MIDRSILNEVGVENPDLQVAVEAAIQTIGNSGVLQRQLDRAFESIASGSVSEDPAELASRILRYRQENHGVIALVALADELKKESRNA